MVDRPIKKPLPLFSLRLRRARLNSVYKGSRMTQQDAAALCGVGITTYWRWENGVQMPGATSLARIGEVLNVSEDEVWADVGFIAPDMLQFLTTTREGLKVVKNVRKIMEVMEQNQQPTTRRGAPLAERFTERVMRDYMHAQKSHEIRLRTRRKRAARKVAALDKEKGR